jgi:hypothetical protein
MNYFSQPPPLIVGEGKCRGVCRGDSFRCLFVSIPYIFAFKIFINAGGLMMKRIMMMMMMTIMMVMTRSTLRTFTTHTNIKILPKVSLVLTESNVKGQKKIMKYR